MDAETQKRLVLEYSEGNQSARQIDNRIWAIYGIYSGLLALTLTMIFRGQPDINWKYRVAISGILVIASLSKMALVGHLQSFSDRIYDRIREIEEKLDLQVHKIFEPPPIESERLWGFHKWLSRYRARDVMQVLGICVIVGAVLYGCDAFLEGVWSMKCDNSVAIAVVAGWTLFGSVFVISVASCIRTALVQRVVKLKEKVADLECKLKNKRTVPSNEDAHCT